MYKSVVGKVLTAYGIAGEVGAMQKGYRNEIWPVVMPDGQKLGLVFFKREPGSLERIRRADHVSEYLANRDLPARRRYDQRVLQLKDSRDVTYVGVYTYLPGRTIPWEAYTMQHIKQLGRVMSDMHTLLKNAPTADMPSVYDEYRALLGRMETYFMRSDVRRAMREKLGIMVPNVRFAKYRQLLDMCDQRFTRQVLHMDFVRGNVLFEGGEVTGVLDFEKTALGHPVVDIARTLAFLLVDCKYKSPEQVYKYFLYSGYKKRGASKDIGDLRILGAFVELFLLYDFYKFLRHNPYEHLAQNEHYLRTKALLQKYGMIETTK